MYKLKNILKEVLSEASMDTSMFTYKMADSFTPSELKRLNSDKKISDEMYNGAIEIQRSWKQSHPTMKIGHGAYRKEMTTFLDKSTKELTEDGYPGDPIHVLEKGLKQITGQPVSVSDRPGQEYRAKWSYMKKELQNSAWNKALDFIEAQGGTIDTSKSDNYYEANWEREEPAEAVPTIYFTLR